MIYTVNAIYANNNPKPCGTSVYLVDEDGVGVKLKVKDLDPNIFRKDVRLDLEPGHSYTIHVFRMDKTSPEPLIDLIDEDENISTVMVWNIPFGWLGNEVDVVLRKNDDD